MINKIKNFFKSHSLTFALYKEMSKIKHIKEIKQKKEHLQIDGVDTIIFLQKTLESNKIPFFFDMGTLLGIIREGRLLKHDMDIDIAVYYTSEAKIKSIKNLLVKNGCIHKYRYVTKDIGIIEDSFLYNNIKFDLCYYHIEKDYDVCFLAYNPNNMADDNLYTVKLYCEHIKKFDKIIFNGYPINIPFNPENYLSQRYGMNWKTPDKKYIYWKGPSAQKISNTTKKITF